MTTGKKLHGVPGTPLVASPTETDRTIRWRRQELLAAGFDELTARRLAADLEVDIHVLLCLVETGGDGRLPRLWRRRRGLRS